MLKKICIKNHLLFDDKFELNLLPHDNNKYSYNGISKINICYGNDNNERSLFFNILYCFLNYYKCDRQIENYYYKLLFETYYKKKDIEYTLEFNIGIDEYKYYIRGNKNRISQEYLKKNNELIIERKGNYFTKSKIDFDKKRYAVPNKCFILQYFLSMYEGDILLEKGLKFYKLIKETFFNSIPVIEKTYNKYNYPLNLDNIENYSTYEFRSYFSDFFEFYENKKDYEYYSLLESLLDKFNLKLDDFFKKGFFYTDSIKEYKILYLCLNLIHSVKKNTTMFINNADIFHPELIKYIISLYETSNTQLFINTNNFIYNGYNYNYYYFNKDNKVCVNKYNDKI